MKLSTLINFTRQARDEFTLDVFECREFAENVKDVESDFTIGTVRFIHADEIDSILADELGGDLYVLGCFNAWFLADVLDIDSDVIEAMQEVEAYEAIGKLVMSMGKLDELVKSYASSDGYGHHFNSWDGSEMEIGDYHAFDNR